MIVKYWPPSKDLGKPPTRQLGQSKEFHPSRRDIGNLATNDLTTKEAQKYTQKHLKTEQIITKVKTDQHFIRSNPELTKKNRGTNLIHVANNEGKRQGSNQFISIRNILPRRPIRIKPHFIHSISIARIVFRSLNRPNSPRFIDTEPEKNRGNLFVDLDIFFLLGATVKSDA